MLENEIVDKIIQVLNEDSLKRKWVVTTYQGSPQKINIEGNN